MIESLSFQQIHWVITMTLNTQQYIAIFNTMSHNVSISQHYHTPEVAANKQPISKKIISPLRCNV